MRESDWLQAVLDANDQPVFALDSELRYTAFNSAHADVMRALFGAEIALGGRLADYQAVKADRDAAQANLERALAGEHIVASAFSGEPGRERYFDIVHDPLTDAVGTIVGVVVHADDVSERQRAQNEFRASEERYSQLFASMPDGFAYCRMLYDEEGRPEDFVYLTVNPAFERLTGLRDVTGKRVTEVIPSIKEETPELLETYGAVARTGQPTEFEIDFTPLHLWLQVSAFCPEPDHFVAVFSNVTERKRAEAALREDEAYLEAILDSAADGILAVDNSGRVLKANRRFAELWRIPEALLESGDDAALLAFVVDQLADPEAFLAKVQSLYGSDVTDLDTLTFKDGRVFERHSSATLQGSKVTGRVWSFHDVTVRKQAEGALRESEAHYRSLFDSTDSVMLLMDGENGAIVEANPAACAWYGWSREEMLAMHIGQINTLPEAKVQAEMKKAVARTGGVFFFKHRLADGTVRDVEVFSTPLKAQGRSLLYSMVHDITERRQAEQRLRDSVLREAAITDGVIAALSQSVEVRDPYTAGHERRVSELAVAVARQLGLDEDHVRWVQVAGMLHDLGKVVVPAEILAKPGRLSAIEFALIKGHPQAAYDILEPIAFDFPLAEIVVQHHERLDGSGYPQGLSGEEIMQEARILAVADVVEAMSSHRPYRPALGMEAALAEIRQDAGVKFDADVVAACARVFDGDFEFAD